jgi:ribosome-binding protein aMBF1 (putative translation factor)
MNTNRSTPNSLGVDFSDDLARRLRDPELAAEFHEARNRASLGLKIAKMRTAQGMSQAELADKLHTTQSVISRYESADYTSYRMDTLKRLAAALGGELVVEIHGPESADT